MNVSKCKNTSLLCSVSWIMAEKIKSVSKFSGDAINMAISTLPQKEKEIVDKILDGILSNLGTKEKKQAMEKKTSDEVLFVNNILPQIKRKIEEIEARDLQKFTISVDFKIKTSFADMSDTDMYKEHVRIISLETGLNNLTIIVQFSRGKFYLDLASRLTKLGNSLKKAIETGSLTNVSYKTALRYMTLASIISKYPRLILCELSFAQIIKHKSRLRKFLSESEGQSLGDRLSLPIDVIAQDNDLSIEHVDMDEPKISFKTDPDWMYLDKSTSDVPTDNAVSRWAESAHGIDETEELECYM